jgi:uncharacterized membrane protein YukC
MKKIYPVLILLALVAGCNQLGSSSQGQGNDIQRQIGEYDARLQTMEEQQRQYDQQSRKADEQQARFDKLLDRWEKQADRYDALLTKWEKQTTTKAK